MSRPIKFRGKRVDNGEWVYGSPVVEPIGIAWISRYYHRGEWEQVDPESVGQYTSLHDKNGKEIYEGDIVNFRRGEEKLYIAFNSGQWSMCTDVTDPNKDYRNLDFYVKHGSSIEIISTIYDNPSLLEAQP